MNELELYQQLRQWLDPIGLCAFLGKRTRHGKRCNHTFRYTREYVSQFAQEGTQADDVERVLKALGGNCDCEVGLNLCSRLSELGAMADMEGD
jgi:hypothetical protein